MHILATASLSKKVLGQKGPFVKKEFNLKSCLTFYIKAELILFSRIFAESNTVRPRDTRPRAARTSQVHVFELGPKKFEMNEFMK